MELLIFTPDKKQAFQVNWVEINTPAGNYIIQKGHAPTAFTLSTNQPLLYELKDGSVQSLVIQQGIAEISRHGIIILIK
jgi:F0F1-type ATP synthase epsilon subunit